MVRLRAMTHDDIPAIVAACRDPEIPRWTSVPQPYTQADALAFLVHAEPRRVIADGDGRLLGVIGMPDTSDPDEVEFGYWLAAEARGRGVMTQALRLAEDWAREEGYTGARLLVHRDNERSLAAGLRAGYEDTGERMPCPRQRCEPASDAPTHALLRKRF